MADIAKTEIRKLASGQICQLVQILEFDKGWQKLMNEIRDDGEQKKYEFEDMRRIEDASIKDKRACSEIFLEEWGTSGRSRPTVQLLFDYLQKADLRRAADYVAKNLLKVDIPFDDTDMLLEYTLTNPGLNFHSSIYEDNTVPVGENDVALPVNPRSVINDERVTKIPYEKLKIATDNFHERLKVGSGGFGSVYSGKLNGVDVAIKKLNRDAMEHYEHELIILLAGVEHKNLLPPLAVSDDNSLCLVYKFMSNGSLEDRLALKDRRLHPLSWQKRISIARDIAEGLKHLQELPKPIVHRDVKSSNILLDEDDVAKAKQSDYSKKVIGGLGLCKIKPIGDFGLVRMKNNRLTSLASTLQGTRSYMAPEALHGQISLKIDVFSFGMIILELLTGRPIIDESQKHLMYFLDEEMMDGTGNIENFLDQAAGEWNINVANQLNELAWNCLERKVKTRLSVQEVNSILNELYRLIQ